MSGAGIVRLRNGDSFRGRFEIKGGWVFFTGRLINGSICRPEVERIWPRSQVVSIKVEKLSRATVFTAEAVAA